MSLHLSSYFVYSPPSSRVNCDVEEDHHVTLGHLGGSERTYPVLVNVLEQ